VQYHSKLLRTVMWIIKTVISLSNQSLLYALKDYAIRRWRYFKICVSFHILVSHNVNLGKYYLLQIFGSNSKSCIRVLSIFMYNSFSLLGKLFFTSSKAPVQIPNLGKLLFTSFFMFLNNPWSVFMALKMTFWLPPFIHSKTPKLTSLSCL